MKILKTIPRKTWRKPQDERQITSLTQRGCTAAFDSPERTRLQPLKKRLLGFGGWAVIFMPTEPDLEKILTRGILVDGERATMQRARQSECHCNSAEFWIANRTFYEIMTGYALSKDGLWRQHSWLLDLRKMNIVETTEERVAYFGYRLSYDEAVAFTLSQLE